MDVGQIVVKHPAQPDPFVVVGLLLLLLIVMTDAKLVGDLK